MQLRSPRYAVVTYALVGLFAAAFGLKLASLYLPERQPNRLRFEYGTYVRHGLRQKVDWYAFSEEAFELARRSRKLILLDIGSTLSGASRILQTNFLESEDFVRLMNNHFVSVKCDAFETPWLVDAVGINSSALYEAGGALIVVLDPEGRILEYCPIRIDSLQERLEAVARDRYQGASKLGTRVHLAESTRLKASAVEGAKLDPDAAPLLRDRWQQALSNRRLARSPLPVSATQPAMLLESGKIGLTTLSSLWLLEMIESPCYDHVGGGFFFQTAQPNWLLPTASKSTGTNALLAGLYARASRLVGADLFTSTAKQTASWVMTMQDPATGLFFTGVGTETGEEGTGEFYEWTAEDIADFDGFRLVQDGGSRGFLALERAANWIDAVSPARAERAAQAQKLQRKRKDRKQPDTDKSIYADVNGQVIAGLFEYARQADDARASAAAKVAYAAIISKYTQTFGDVLHADKELGRTTGYAGDYVWVARAAIENYLATGNAAALQDAIRIMGRFAELFAHPSGAYVSFLDSQLYFAKFSLPVIQIADDYTESICALAARNHMDLATITGDAGFRHLAVDAMSAVHGTLDRMDLPPAGCVRAIGRIYDKAIVVRGPDATAVATRLARRYRYMCCPVPPTRSLADGTYIESGGKLTLASGADLLALLRSQVTK
ncbi:MAG: thioredoxin domain-containing protein [Armatimonadetes bacterium]|nr:thioredoxin domain-containing protein [Armatimonadota bacterium]